MDPDQRRIEEARARNLAYIRRLDERDAERAADEFLRQHVGGSSDRDGTETREKAAAAIAGQNLKNTSVYVTGLTTYMACKQLEGACSKIGKVRRIKFYKDDRGGLKGDALVTFASHGMMLKAVERLNHFEIKPGVILTATEASFGASSKNTSADPPATGHEETTLVTSTGPERLFSVEVLQQEQDNSSHAILVGASGAAAEDKDKEANPEPVEKTAELELPSRSVILKHAWDPLAPQPNLAEFFSELENDMQEECGKHGPVEHVHILPTGGVMVRYQALAGAIKCLQVMHGRWFDGRQLEARFDPSTPEEPADDETKLDAFFASLG